MLAYCMFSSYVLTVWGSCSLSAWLTTAAVSLLKGKCAALLMCSLFEQELELVVLMHLALQVFNTDPDSYAPAKQTYHNLWFHWQTSKPTVFNENHHECFDQPELLDQHLDSFSLVFPPVGSKHWQNRRSMQLSRSPSDDRGIPHTYTNIWTHIQTHTNLGVWLRSLSDKTIKQSARTYLCRNLFNSWISSGKFRSQSASQVSERGQLVAFAETEQV